MKLITINHFFNLSIHKSRKAKVVRNRRKLTLLLIEKMLIGWINKQKIFIKFCDSPAYRPRLRGCCTAQLIQRIQK